MCEAVKQRGTANEAHIETDKCMLALEAPNSQVPCSGDQHRLGPHSLLLIYCYHLRF